MKRKQNWLVGQVVSSSLKQKAAGFMGNTVIGRFSENASTLKNCVINNDLVC